MHGFKRNILRLESLYSSRIRKPHFHIDLQRHGHALYNTFYISKLQIGMLNLAPFRPDPDDPLSYNET
jgi:hypothetical protein